MLEQSNAVANCLEDSANEVLFASLIDVLNKELAIFGELKDFLLAERKMLMKASALDQINENNAVKENIILKSRILEEVRANILKKIARNLDLDHEQIKLSEVDDYAPLEQRQVLDKLKTELSEIAKMIRLMNDENSYLLDATINNVKGSLDFISSLVNRSGIYLGNGKIDEIQRNGRFLRAEG